MGHEQRKPWRTGPGVPRYKHLAEVLRQRITGCHAGYCPGSQFPTEGQLSAESGYSRETVRAAVRVLREEGLLEVVLGVGTFVTGRESWKAEP
jgi:DNA-binding GntR family transcriptional regulator